MKKKILNFFIAFCLIFALSLFANTKTFYLYADGNEVVGLNVGLYESDDNSPDMPHDANNKYEIEFNTNFDDEEEIKEGNYPYGYYYIGVEPQMSNIRYSDMENEDKSPIIIELAQSMTINESTLIYHRSDDETNYTATTDDYIVTLYTTQQSLSQPKVYFKIVPLAAGTMDIQFSCNAHTKKITLDCLYTDSTKVTLVRSGGEYEQLWEDFQNITIKAKFNYEKYRIPDVDYTCLWKINGELQSELTDTIVITREQISIGTFKVKLDVQGHPTLGKEVEIIITTNVDYEVTLTHTGGDLNQTIGENIQPIQFKATIPTQEEYTVSWYLKREDTNMFKKLPESGEHYQFNPLAYNKAGTYAVYAQIEVKNTKAIVRSQVDLIVLSTKDVEEQRKFTISYKEHNNPATNITAYECSVDADEYFLDENIIWSVNGIQYALGSTFEFEPIEAKEYLITVRLRTPNGKILQATPITITARPVEDLNIWLYVAIAGVALVGICVLAIIISNKKREKIW